MTSMTNPCASLRLLDMLTFGRLLFAFGSGANSGAGKGNKTPRGRRGKSQNRAVDVETVVPGERGRGLGNWSKPAWCHTSLLFSHSSELSCCSAIEAGARDSGPVTPDSAVKRVHASAGDTVGSPKKGKGKAKRRLGAR
jgi:hypothetical protein